MLHACARRSDGKTCAMSLWEYRIEIEPARVEEVDALMQGLELEGWNLLEDVIVKRAWIQGIGPDKAELDRHWAGILQGLAESAVPHLSAPVVSMLADQDWKESYKAHFKAWRFGPLHWVPEWEKATYTVPAGESVLWLDPGLAFGTGNHETTRLCCEDLVAFAAERSGRRGEAGRSVIDAGCGSGILALSAALLGLAPVSGFDNDPEAVRVSGENAVANGLLGRVVFELGDLQTGFRARQADLVLANIQADVLMRFHDSLLQAVAPQGWLVLSGILAHELDSVRACFVKAAPGWRVATRVMGEWSAVQLVRP